MSFPWMTRFRSQPSSGGAADVRAAARDALLRQAGWERADSQVLAGDASTRRYERLRLGDETLVLMDAPPSEEKPACPPDADEAQRAALGYNASARLAGPNAAAFAGLAMELSARGFSAPRVVGADLAHGFLLLEDLGDALFSQVMAARRAEADEATLYGAAVDALAALRRASLPLEVGVNGARWPILSYDSMALHTEADLFVDWYAPHRAGLELSDGARADWRAAWADVFTHLQGEPPVLTLRDVHADNLIWLPEREGPARAGLLDFQDALFGHPAYDMVSLLRDARRDVDPDVAEAMIRRYVDKAYIADETGFRRACAVLAAQRNAKVLGIFVRLTVRDGKAGYLERLPRAARYFLEDVRHPDLEPVRAWIEKHTPGLAAEAGA